MALELRLDSIKWPKDFPELKILDDLLRCGICYGYIRTCMTTSCSHNYCSLCIRKSMQYKSQCPACFEESFEVNLRNNRAFDRFVELFTSIRDKLLRHLRIADIQLSQHNDDNQFLPRCIQLELPNDDIKKIKGESSRAKHASSVSGTPKAETSRACISRRLDSDLISPPSHDEGLPTIPKMFLSPKKDTVKQKQNVDVATVPCPVCGVDIPERNINLHLDHCLQRSEKPVPKSPEKKKKRSPIAKLVYSMMSDKDLRKRLKDHGLSSQGDKKALTNRLQRFTVLYNSECDSDNPRPVADIIRQIEKEENGEKKSVANLLAQPRLPPINRKTDPKIIEEENKKYINENKDSFTALINTVRMREGRPVPRLRLSPQKILGNILCISDDSNDENAEKVQEEKNIYPPKEKRYFRPCKRPGNIVFSDDDSDDGNAEEVQDVKNISPPKEKRYSRPCKRPGNIIFSDDDSDGDNQVGNAADVSPQYTLPGKAIRKSNKGIGKDVDEEIFEIPDTQEPEIDKKNCASSDGELSEEYPPSPVLQSTTTPLYNDTILKDLSSSHNSKRKQMPKLKPLLSENESDKPVNGNCETQLLSCDSDEGELSPSCIAPENDGNNCLSEQDSDAEDIMSDSENLDEGWKLKDSQIDDPNFEILTEDLENSEEIFTTTPRTRQSTRKLSTPTTDNKNKTPKRKIKTPTSSGTESTVRTLRKRAKH